MASGTSTPIAPSPSAETTGEAFSDEAVRELGQPLDPARVKTRQGRGTASLSYLETHDVKRTLNRIFGFGNWGYEIVVQEELGAVEVVNSRDASKKGWHVGYRCVVRLSVRGGVPVSDAGYGDGVEYGPAARVTAQELALKESASDALKRAAVALGDQFGLILYAKAEDQARLSSAQAADEAQAAPPSDTPMSIADALSRLEGYTADPKPWVKEAAEAQFPGLTMTNQAALTQGQRTELLRRLQVVVYDLERNHLDPYKDPEVTRSTMRAAFSKAFEGLAVAGPDPFTPPIPFG